VYTIRCAAAGIALAVKQTGVASVKNVVPISPEDMDTASKKLESNCFGGRL
jgi:hypothetical protein